MVNKFFSVSFVSHLNDNWFESNLSKLVVSTRLVYPLSSSLLALSLNYSFELETFKLLVVMVYSVNSLHSPFLVIVPEHI